MYLAYHTNDSLASISWHPTNEYRMLSISDSGMVELVQLHESIPIACSVYGELSWAYGKAMCNTKINTEEYVNEHPIKMNKEKKKSKIFL